MNRAIFLLTLFSWCATAQIFVNRADIGNIHLQSNTISTSNTNGDLTFDLNGTGSILFNDLTASKVLYLDASKKLTSSTVSPTELALLSGLSGTVLTDSNSVTVTNKTINASSNTLSNIGNSAIAASAGIAYSKLSLSNSIVNADIATAAAIAYSKLNLSGSILASDIATGAGIPYSKLSLAGSIVNADVSSSAAVAYSKLALSNSIVNADIATAAAIAYSKLNLSGSILASDIATGAAIPYSKLSLAGSIVNADVSSSAAIAYSKLALTGSIVNADVSGSAAIARGKIATGTGNVAVVNSSGGALSELSCSNGQVMKWAAGAPACGSDATGSGSLTTRAVTSTDTATTSDNVLILSGASFTETLFTAVGNAGVTLKLVHGGTSLSNVYTLATTSAQTIGGVASGSYALYTNGEVLTLISDGANWIILDHKTDTGWVSAGATPITATSAYVYTVTAANATAGATYSQSGFTFTVTTTIAGGTTLTCSGTGTPATSGTLTKVSGTGDSTITFSSRTITGVPTKGATVTTDTFYWRRDKDHIEFLLDYVHTLAGSNGSGTHLFQVPTNLTIATTNLLTNGVSTSSCIGSQVGQGQVSNSATGTASASLPARLLAYNSSYLIIGQYTGTTNACTLMSSSNSPNFGNTALSLNFRGRYQVSGWQP